ncbi:MAG: HdeD family acid-resistance protein [Desulfarculus sp.]|jgi:uncharacterized membrane protein HdeD (DUF308 family)|nr:MAG: HdeD family acid-resistance protein [Desulfarculus sp.]
MANQTDTGSLQAQVWHALHDHWRGLLILGIVFLILGSAAIVAPWAAALAVNVLVGWLLLISGVVQILHSFQAHRWGLIWNLLGSAVYIVAGVLLLTQPLTGVITLTLLLAAFFIVEGVYKLVLAFKVKPSRAWGWLFFSGLLALLLGLLIWARWPGDAPWVLGLLLGIDLIFGGWSLIMVSMAARRGAAPGV